MATIAELLEAANRKVQRGEETKALLKTAINGSGNTVGDKFSDYPVAVSNGKALVAGAITDMGVSTSADATFEEMEANIRAIQSSPAFETSLVQVFFDTSGGAVVYCYQNGDFQVLNIYASGEGIEVDKNSIFVMRVYSGADQSGGGSSGGSISILDSLFPEDPSSNGAMAVALVEGDGSIYL